MSQFSECGTFQTLGKCTLFYMYNNIIYLTTLLITCAYFFYLCTAFTARDPAVTSIPADTTMSCQCTISIAFASILSVVLALCVVTFTTVIVASVRSKRKVQTEAYYDTINVHHHSFPQAIGTEMNVAYGHTMS